MTDWQQRLEGFRKLERNWDSYDACPITDIAIAVATELIQRSSWQPSFVTPTPEGGVQIDYCFDDFGDVELEVAIDPTGQLETLLIQRIYTQHDDVPLATILALIEKSKHC